MTGGASLPPRAPGEVSRPDDQVPQYTFVCARVPHAVRRVRAHRVEVDGGRSPCRTAEARPRLRAARPKYERVKPKAPFLHHPQGPRRRVGQRDWVHRAIEHNVLVIPGVQRLKDRDTHSESLPRYATQSPGGVRHPCSWSERKSEDGYHRGHREARIHAEDAVDADKRSAGGRRREAQIRQRWMSPYAARVAPCRAISYGGEERRLSSPCLRGRLPILSRGKRVGAFPRVGADRSPGRLRRVLSVWRCRDGLTRLRDSRFKRKGITRQMVITNHRWQGLRIRQGREIHGRRNLLAGLSGGQPQSSTCAVAKKDFVRRGRFEGSSSDRSRNSVHVFGRVAGREKCRQKITLACVVAVGRTPNFREFQDASLPALLTAAFSF